MKIEQIKWLDTNRGMKKYHISDNALRDIKNINWVVFDKICRWDLSSTEEIRNNT